MRALICVGLLLLATGCPREQPAGPRGTATHPWELPGWESATAPAPVETTESDAEIDQPARHGPSLPSEDTLDPALLPGQWLQICIVAEERMQLIPPGEMDIFQFGDNGQAYYQGVAEGQLGEPMSGSWYKTQPGVLTLDFGGSADFYGELYRGAFLYLWNYDRQIGFWYARVPTEATAGIERNRFDTSRGPLLFTDVVGLSFSGSAGEAEEIAISTGYYFAGVLSLRWEDPQYHSSGYAMFIVSPDWQELMGTWWIDDYEAAPFGGSWDGTAQ